MTFPLPINIDSLLRGGTIESERVEYKAGWNPERVLHRLAAFANDFHNLGGCGVGNRESENSLSPSLRLIDWGEGVPCPAGGDSA